MTAAVSPSDILLIVAGLLVLISVIQPLARLMNLPHTVLLAVVGVLIGSAAGLLLHTDLTGAFNAGAELLSDFPITASGFLFIFLPILLFQASLTIDVQRILEDSAPILVLAVLAVLVSTLIVGLTLWPFADVSLVACLLVGAIVATTDPVAVIAIFRDLGAPSRLTRLVEGESLLNDAAAIALFTVLLDVLVAGEDVRVSAGVVIFLGSFFGGAVIGFVGARVMMLLLPLLRDLRLAEVTLTMALPYIVFVLSERYLSVSGVVAVVAAGLVLSSMGRVRFTPETWTFLEEVWEQMAFWASSLVFILASILVPRLLIGSSPVDVLLVGLVVLAALIARGLVLFGLLPLLSAAGLSQRVSNAYKFVILWGGLRGAVTLVLALAITENRMVDPEIQRFVAVLATGFVLFTLLINSTTLRPAIRLLKLDRLSPIDQALRRHVLALSLSNVREAIQEAAEQYKIGRGPAHDVLEPYAARVAAVTADKSLHGKIADRDLITIGLVALANRERELFLDHFRHGTLSRPTLERLLVNVEQIIDGARTDGRVGYNRATGKRLAFGRSFRLAHGLHRFWKVERPLMKRLEDRFEALLVSRIVLEELERFVRRQMTLVLGQRVAELLDKTLSHRLEATGKALDALRLQYPAYADALERRFLRQSALRLESAEYDILRDETLIGPELYNDLRRELQAARAVATHRPRLDLGLDTRDLVMQFPMFSALETDQIEEICRLLRPRFAVPGERLIGRGDRGESVFFISSGAVEVSREDQRIRLGRGDFFGELAPLSGRRREADVTALGYCQLLVLDGADFQHLLAADPTIKAQIDRVADERRQKIRPRN